MDFVRRLVDRTRAESTAVRPVVGPWAPSSQEGPLAIDIERVVDQPATSHAAAEARREEVAQARVQPAASVIPNVRASAPREHAAEPATRAASRALPVEIVERRSAAVRGPDAEAPSMTPPATSSDPGPLGIHEVVTSPAGTSIAVPGAPSARTSRAPAVAAREPAPVIRVHIGRIDVRAATPPPAPAQRRTEPLPSEALGRYLDQRERRR